MKRNGNVHADGRDIPASEVRADDHLLNSRRECLGEVTRIHTFRGAICVHIGQEISFKYDPVEIVKVFR